MLRFSWHFRWLPERFQRRLPDRLVLLLREIEKWFRCRSRGPRHARPLQISKIGCCLIQFFGLNRIDLIKGLWRNLVADTADFVLDGIFAPKSFVEGPRITFVFFVLRLRQILVIPSIVRRRCNEFCGVWQLISIYNKTHHNLSGVVAAAHVNMAHESPVAFLTVGRNTIRTQKIHYGFDNFINYRVLNGT